MTKSEFDNMRRWLGDVRAIVVKQHAELSKGGVPYDLMLPKVQEWHEESFPFEENWAEDKMATLIWAFNDGFMNKYYKLRTKRDVPIREWNANDRKLVAEVNRLLKLVNDIIVAKNIDMDAHPMLPQNASIDDIGQAIIFASILA